MAHNNTVAVSTPGGLLDAHGRPVQSGKTTPAKTPCPACHAPYSRRVLSAGFGPATDLCGRCGYDFKVKTL